MKAKRWKAPGQEKTPSELYAQSAGKLDRLGGNRRERSVLLDGYRFDSAAESELYLFLKEELMRDKIVSIKCQDTLYLSDARFIMKPDFRVTLPDGSREWHEMKGNYESDQWKRNTKLWRAGYGPIPGAKMTVWKIGRRGLYVWKVIIAKEKQSAEAPPCP